MDDETAVFAKLRLDAEGALHTLVTRDGWLRWLQFQSQHPTMPFLAAMAVFAQRPTARMVATEREWRRRGRTILPGERPILIPSSGRDGIVEHVFDVAQTRGAPLSHASLVQTELRQFAQRTSATLRTLARAQGIRVVTARTRAGMEDADGFWHPMTRVITVARVDPLRTVEVLAHELAHAWVQRPEILADHERWDTEAESIAYIFCRARGLIIDSVARAYFDVTKWDEWTPDQIRTSGDMIQRTAWRMLKAVDLLERGRGLEARQAGRASTRDTDRGEEEER